MIISTSTAFSTGLLILCVRMVGSSRKCSGGPWLITTQNFSSNKALHLELMAMVNRRRQILLYDLHGLHIPFYVKMMLKALLLTNQLGKYVFTIAVGCR